MYTSPEIFWQENIIGRKKKTFCYLSKTHSFIGGFHRPWLRSASGYWLGLAWGRHLPAVTMWCVIGLSALGIDLDWRRCMSAICWHWPLLPGGGSGVHPSGGSRLGPCWGVGRPWALGLQVNGRIHPGIASYWQSPLAFCCCPPGLLHCSFPGGCSLPCMGPPGAPVPWWSLRCLWLRSP